MANLAFRRRPDWRFFGTGLSYLSGGGFPGLWFSRWFSPRARVSGRVPLTDSRRFVPANRLFCVQQQCWITKWLFGKKDFEKRWWAMRDSNPRPTVCKTDVPVENYQ